MAGGGLEEAQASSGGRSSTGSEPPDGLSWPSHGVQPSPGERGGGDASSRRVVSGTDGGTAGASRRRIGRPATWSPDDSATAAAAPGPRPDPDPHDRGSATEPDRVLVGARQREADHPLPRRPQGHRLNREVARPADQRHRDDPRDQGLTNGTPYVVRVRAVNSAGTEGPWSESGSGTPAAAAAAEEEPMPTPALPIVGVLALAAGLLTAGRRRLARR